MSKKSKPPRFHHYIPRTYLKHWLDDRGLIYIYNKNTGEIKPSSIKGQYFGKNNLNTIYYPDGDKGYWVEKVYADIEGRVSPVLNKIATSQLSNSSAISYEDKLMLSMFVSIQFWRLPANSGFVKDHMSKEDLASLGLSVIDRQSGEKMVDDKAQAFYDDIYSTDLFQKSYPALKALLSTAELSKFESLKDWGFYYQEPGFNISSDNPILYMESPSVKSLLKDFILPISPGVLLISSNKQPISELSTALNILQFCHATQFVVGSNVEYLRSLADEYEDNFKSQPLDDVEAYVYSRIFEGYYDK